MKKLTRLMSILLCIAFATANSAYAIESYRADVSATRHGALDIKLSGVINFEIAPNGDWQYTLNAKGGPIKTKEISRGSMDGLDFLPEHYERNTKILFVKENVEWNFDWEKKKLSGKIKKDSFNYDLNTIVHDPISFQLPLQAALNNNETKFAYQYLRYKRPAELAYEVIGEELLMLETGPVHTNIIKQTKPNRSDEEKYIWVAKDYGFIPVRFATFKNDKLKDEIIVNQLWINGELIRFER
jgi:hypothetical protein